MTFCRYYNKTYALHEMLQHSKKLGLKTETEQRLLGLKQKIGDKANLNVKRFSLEPSAVLGGASEDDEGDDTEDELFPLPTSIPNRFATPSELEMPDNADSESDMAQPDSAREQRPAMRRRRSLGVDSDGASEL